MFKTISIALGPIADVIARLSKTQKILFASLILTAIAGVSAVPLTKADNVVFNGPRDCNNNSILYCGAMSVGELQQKYNANPNAQQVYSYYGIDSADMGRLQNTAKAGKVYKNGNVVVNGQVVATNSFSAGWQPQPTSTQATFNGVTFYNTANAGVFLSESIDAFVVMDNGVFAFAILSSCGNPVGGQAGTHEYKLDKTVRKAGGAWVKTTPVNYGEVYEYKVEVTNTGTGHVRWVRTKDVLPADQKVVPGSLTLNGAYLPESHLFVEGSFINRLAPGNKLTYIFKATTAQPTQPEPCTNKESINVANTTALMLPPQTSNASVTLTCKEPPKPENPDYTILKQVQTIGSNNWSEDVTVPSGTDVRYKVVVSSTGKAPATNVVAKDQLPAGVTYKAGTLKKDNNNVNEADANKFFGSGLNIGTLQPNTTVTFTFEATAGTADPAKCKEGKMTNVASITGDKLPPKNDDANVSVTCKPVPENPDYTILKQVQTIGSNNWSEDVTVPSGTDVRYKVVVSSTGKAPATNVVAKDQLPAGVTYKAGTLKKDNNNVNEADANKFFGSGLNIGTLQPNTTVTFTFEATAGTADPAKCKEGKMTNVASITGDKLPPKNDDANVSVTCKPAEKISCDMLTATSLGNRKFQYTVKYTATQGATFQTASYNFGDNSNNLVTDKTTVEHTYAKDGIFTTTVELTFLVNGKQQKVTSDNCKVNVQASTPPSMCTIPGKQHLPANSPECVNDVVVPTSIPNTGAGSLIALFVGSSIISTFAYRFWISRNQS